MSLKKGVRRIQVTMRNDDYEKVETMAKERRLSMSSYCREAAVRMAEVQIKEGNVMFSLDKKRGG